MQSISMNVNETMRIFMTKKLWISREIGTEKKQHRLNEINAKQDGNHNCFFRNWINYKNKTRTFCVFMKSFMESSHSKRPHIDPFVCLLTTRQSYRWIVANELLIVFWLDGRSDYNHFRLFNTQGVYLYDGT